MDANRTILRSGVSNKYKKLFKTHNTSLSFLIEMELSNMSIPTSALNTDALKHVTKRLQEMMGSPESTDHLPAYHTINRHCIDFICLLFVALDPENVSSTEVLVTV